MKLIPELRWRKRSSFKENSSLWRRVECPYSKSASGDIAHWLMAPLSSVSLLIFLTPLCSLCFWVQRISPTYCLVSFSTVRIPDFAKCAVSQDSSPIVTNVWWRTLGRRNVKCQVSECFWETVRAYTRNDLQQCGQCFLQHPSHQTNHCLPGANKCITSAAWILLLLKMVLCFLLLFTRRRKPVLN